MSMRETPTDSRHCFDCAREVSASPGVYYCDDCVAEQMREQGDELAAFDAYHRWIDRITTTDRRVTA